MSEESRKALKRVIAWRGDPAPYTADRYSGFLFFSEGGKPYLPDHYQTVLRYAMQHYKRTHEEQLPKIFPHCYVTRSAPGLQAKT